jgi:hypothetical protein
MKEKKEEFRVLCCAFVCAEYEFAKREKVEITVSLQSTCEHVM